MRLWLLLGIALLLGAPSGMAMEQSRIADLNARFPNIGNELQDAVQQKLTQHGGQLSVAELVARLVGNPAYIKDRITDAKTFELHSELMLLYPALGQYPEALQEAKLLRDFVLTYPPDNPKVVVTFRGVYIELLIINGQYAEALRECEETLALDVNEEGTYLSRGVASVNLGQLAPAFEDLKTLTQQPDPKNYAQQLFEFIMNHREAFRTPQVQKNTMIDVMLKGMAPEPRAKIKIPANAPAATAEPPREPVPEATPSPAPPIELHAVPTPQPVVPQATPTSLSEKAKPALTLEAQLRDPLLRLVNLDAQSIGQLLGPPLSESKGETTVEREYAYNGNRLAIGFAQTSRQILSLQMFFLPPVTETEAFTRIGLLRRELPATVVGKVLKVWKPYGAFAKVRLSLNEGNVVAIIVEP